MSPTGAPLQLPITIGDSSVSCLPIIKAFYSVDYAADTYKETFSYLNSENLVCLDLVPTDAQNHDVWRFGNLATQQKPQVLIPPTIDLTIVPLVPLMTVDVEQELELFNGMELNAPLDIFKLSDTPMALSNLLNKYDHLKNIWRTSTFTEYSSSGFSISYNGLGSNCPMEWNVNPNAKQVVVVNILQGYHLGVVYLQYLED